MKTSGTNITEAGQHLADNPTCSMSFEVIQVLAYENKMRKRRILESLYTVVAHMLVIACKNYGMIYAYAVSFIDTHN